MEILKNSAKCCDTFDEMRHHFDWFSYQDGNGQKVICTPVLKNTNLRVSYCPSCGKEVRDIELKTNENDKN